MAIQASLTGHLVFSTLHTNSAAGILPRLLDMGIEPFLIASTIRVVIGQRLIRRNSDDNEEYKSSLTESASIKSTLQGILPPKDASPEALKKYEERAGYVDLPNIDDEAYNLYKGVPNKNNPLGTYKGRVGIYEAFAVSEKIQELIVKRATSSAIQAQAQEEGMITMRQDGYLKVLEGMTTPSEIDRVISTNSI